MDHDQQVLDYRWARSAVRRMLIRALLGMSQDMASHAQGLAIDAIRACRP